MNEIWKFGQIFKFVSIQAKMSHFREHLDDFSVSLFDLNHWHVPLPGLQFGSKNIQKMNHTAWCSGKHVRFRARIGIPVLSNSAGTVFSKPISFSSWVQRDYISQILLQWVDAIDWVLANGMLVDVIWVQPAPTQSFLGGFQGSLHFPCLQT